MKSQESLDSTQKFIELGQFHNQNFSSFNLQIIFLEPEWKLESLTIECFIVRQNQSKQFHKKTQHHTPNDIFLRGFTSA